MTECFYAFSGPPLNADDFRRCTEQTILVSIIAPGFLLICILSRLLYYFFSRKKTSRDEEKILFADGNNNRYLRTSLKSQLEKNGATHVTKTSSNGTAEPDNRQQSHHVPADETRRTWHRAIDFAALVLAILLVCCSIFELTATVQWSTQPAWTFAITGAALQLSVEVLVVLLVYQSRLMRPHKGHCTDGSVTEGPAISSTTNPLADRTTIFLFLLLSAMMQAVVLSNSNVTMLSYTSATHWYERPPLTLFMAQCVVLGLTVGLLLVYGAAPRSIIHSDSYPPNPLRTASPLTMLTFAWITPLMYTGWQKTLKLDDLWPLKHSQTAKVLLHEKFQPAWRHELERVKQNNAKSSSSNQRLASLMRVLLSTIAWRCIFNVVLLCCSMVLKFATPLLLKALLASLEAENDQKIAPNSVPQSDSSSRVFNQRIVLAVLLFLCNFVHLILESHMQFTDVNIGYDLSKTVILALYEKTLRLSNDAHRSATVGQLINLITVDAQQFLLFGFMCFRIIDVPLTIAISIFLIWRELGVAALAGVVVLFVLIPLTGFISTRQRKYFAAQLTLKDERLRQASEMINGIRILKLYAWEKPFINRLLNIRAQELRNLRTSTLVQAVAYMFTFSSSFFVLLTTFAAYVLASSDNVLTAQKTFVALALFNLLREPLNVLSYSFQFAVQFRISLKRVSKVLLDGERDVNAPVRLPYDANAPVVQIEHGNFAWGRTHSDADAGADKNSTELSSFKPILRDINLSIQPGTLTAIVGQVGCGKSSLCSAILGLMDEVQPPKQLDDGDITSSVVLRGTTSYVPQQAWIRNATLRDNITFFSPFDETKYERILDACALRDDLEMLPAADSTEIGEKGLNLSGGQKQRVALARAAYSNAQVVVMDDPLSAVDAHVGKHIFENLIANKTGLLKQTTRIMATHNIHLLPFVDNIVVMSDGQIVATGTYNELIQAGGPFADFLSSHVQSNKDAADVDDAIESGSDDSTAQPRKLETGTGIDRPKPAKANSLSRSRNSLHSTNADLASALKKQQEIDGKKRAAKLVDEEEAQHGRVGLSVYWTYVKYVSLTLTMPIVFLAIIDCALSVASQLWLALWSSDVAKSRSVAEASSQSVYRLAVYAIIGFSNAIATLLQSVVLAFGALRASRSVHELVLDRVMHAPMTFFDTTPSGRILNRFSRDVDMMDTQIPTTLLYVINALFGIISMLCVVVYGSSSWFLLAAAPLVVMYIMVQRFGVATSTQVRRIESVLRSPMVSHFGETVQGLHVICAMNMQRKFQLEFERLVDQATRPLYCVMTANRWINLSTQFIGNLVVLAASVFAILQHGWNNSSPSTGAASIDSSSAVGLVISNALAVTGSLVMLVRVMAMLENAIVSVERMKEYTEIAQELDREPATTAAAAAASSSLKCSAEIETLAIAEENSPQWPQTGVVEFDNYEARYRPGLDLVLRGITFRTEDSEKIGVAGRTGAGKSSLALALFRMIQPADGSIRVDGRDISHINLFELRSRLSIIPQDPTVFSGTLRFNLDPWASATDEQLWKALRHAHLETFVSSLPDGLEYQVGSDGQKLSVGQKQLVCLARALLRRSKILVLDEATAAVDLETDELIQESIRREFAQSTVITIAHRINTIIGYDTVMVLANGKVQEIGAPQSLLERGEESEFCRLAMESAKKEKTL